MGSHQRPLLFSNLRTALGSLYSLSGCQHIPHHEAHAFLIHLQSRNVRRKLQSAEQRHRDQNNSPNASPIPSPDVPLGSSWLAALTLLCEYHNYSPSYSQTERLFAAQTLLHRLRRVKLAEAVDLEMEVSSFAQISAQNIQAPYLSYIHSVNPYLEPVLTGSHQHDEELMKGELTALTLAGMLYLEACQSRMRTPLLQTLAHAVVTSIFRMYCLTPGAQLVNMVAMVVETVSSKLPSNQQATACTMTLCLSALPDALLGHPGGARGRLSADPRFLRQIGVELRDSGPLERILHSIRVTTESNLWILDLCSNWASLLPISVSLLELVLPVIQSQLRNQQGHAAALKVLINLYEGAAWNLDQILSSTLVLSETKADCRKKKSSRAKKRHQEVLAKNSTDVLIENAEKEIFHRGAIACLATVRCWEEIECDVKVALGEATSHSQIEGEGPVGVLAACANACVPHVLKHPNTENGLLLVKHIGDGIRIMCSSSSRDVRMLALEPLYTLHSTMLELVRQHGALHPDLELVVVEELYICSMGLASACGYPPGYFDILDTISDYDLEVERNDIRDLLRSVGGSSEGGSTVDTGSTDRPLSISVCILYKLLEACKQATNITTMRHVLLSETAVHAFSSLAKPLNHLAKCCVHSSSRTEQEQSIIQMALQVLQESNQITLDIFRDTTRRPNDVSVLMPISRIVNIANASLTPFLSAVATLQDEATLSKLAAVLTNMVLVSIYSLEGIPELAAPSIVPPSMYNIRGTMRLPGGEDHVGCIALMRAAFESEHLAHYLVKAVAPHINRLAQLHQTLKNIELHRGMMVFHGSGVCPQTRRILVGTLCQLEKASHGQLGASTILSELFHSAIDDVLSLQNGQILGEAEFYRLTESTLDLASFAPGIVASLFDSASDTKSSQCLEALTNVCISGYQRFEGSRTADETAKQWSRVRAALFLLMKKSAVLVSDLSEPAIAMIGACIASECEAIQRHCESRVEYGVLFSDDVISTETIPAGIFIMTVTDTLRRQGNGDSTIKFNCIQALAQSSSRVLDTILLPRSGHGFSDPRPTLCEAWFLACLELIQAQPAHPLKETLLVDSFAAVIVLLLYPSMGLTEGDRMNDPGMCLDGPHGLAILSFLAAYFKLGPDALKGASKRLLSVAPIDLGSVHQHSPHEIHGLSVIGAALLRSWQGALPPWALEMVPELYRALFEALGSDSSTFGTVMRMSLEVKLSHTHIGHGSVKPGEPVVGRALYNISEKTKQTFVSETQALSTKGGGESWRRVKVLVKSFCFGKKKDSDFNQKPSPTRWEFERV